MEPLTTIEYADAFFANRLHTETWDAATDGDKRKALSHASSDIFQYFVLHEEAFREHIDEYANRTQVAVERLQNAVCLQAIYVLGTNPAEYPEILTKGIKAATAGPVSVTLDRSFVPFPLAPGVEEMLGDLGEYIGPSEFGTAKTYPLIV